MPAVNWSGASDGGGSSITTGTLTSMNATTGSAGQLFFNTSYNALFTWSTDRWWPTGSPDPRYGFYISDEFTAPALPSQLDWIGAGTVNVVAGSALTPGVFQITTSTALARSSLVLGASAYLFGSMDFYAEAILSIPTLATAGEDFSAVFGFNDNSAFDANSACTDGAYFTLNRAVNGINWITNTTSNTTNTAKNSTTAVVAGTQYRLGIYVNAGTGVTFYVNGTAVTATHSTNIPTGTGRQTGILFKVDKTAGTGASAISLDYFSLYGFFNGQRVA